MADSTNPVDAQNVGGNQVGKRSGLLRDCSLEDLRTHLNQWWEDRTSTSEGGNLNDHFYLIGVVKDMVQDTGELFNITLGILDRLIEATDLQPSDPDTTLGPSKAQTKAHTSKGGLG